MLTDGSNIVVRVTKGGRTLTRRLFKEDMERFVARVVKAALDGRVPGEYAMGFCAALDMSAAGTLDLTNPVGMVLASYRDVADVSCGPRMVTDFLPTACEAIGGAR